MITLKNTDNTVDLQLDVVGYQFPNGTDDWCLLKVLVQQGDDLFEKIDPALEVTDLEHLYHWFSALAEGRLPAYSQLDFTEPCLSLSFLSYIHQVVRISITLNCEIKPDFAFNDPFNLRKEWTLCFDLHEKDFEPILNSIQQWIQHYPSR